MKMLHKRLTLLLLIFIYNIAVAKQLVIESFKLSNGLEVVLIPINRAPVVYHAIWYKVGSADSPQNKSGLAHFVEHLMFKGTNKYPADSFKTIVNKLGGDLYAGTHLDQTVYSITIAKEYLEKIMDLESDRMTNLVFKQNEVAKELQVVLQERRQQIEANPDQLLSEATYAAFFWQHPYGKPIIGFRDHMESYNVEDASKFYHSWYAPNNAILVISGDIDQNTIKPLIDKYYGSIAAKSLPDRASLRGVEPNHNNCTIKTELKDTKLSAHYWRSMYMATNHATDFNSYAALTLLEFILGDDSFGRLRKNLVDQQKIAFSANAEYSGNMLDPMDFSITVIPINSIDSLKTENLVLAEINNLLVHGVNIDELNNAKLQYSTYFRFNHDSIVNIANFFGNNLVHGFSLEQIKNWLTTLQNISIDEINESAKQLFTKPPRVITYAYPIIEN